MEEFILLLKVTALAGIGGTGLGGVIGALFKRDSSKTASLLLSFAAGVMTAIVCFDLILSAIETKTNIYNKFRNYCRCCNCLFTKLIY